MAIHCPPDARSLSQRAEMMAKAVGKRLLELHNVSDRSQGVSYSSDSYYSSVALLAPGTTRSASIVLREGTIKLKADAYLVYLIGD